MKFELINPSDPYTMEAEDMEVAAVACCLLGNGQYALKAQSEDADPKNEVPFFLFGGHDEWFVSKFGMDFENTMKHCMEHRNPALAAAFDSVTLEREERSSINDIGSEAKKLAIAVRRAL